MTLTFRDLNQVEKIAKLPIAYHRRRGRKATTPRSETSATTRRHRTSSSTTATSATGTESRTANRQHQIDFV